MVEGVPESVGETEEYLHVVTNPEFTNEKFTISLNTLTLYSINALNTLNTV